MTRASWLQTLLLCALLFKAMLPAGIMPDQRNGLPTLVMCSDGHRGWGVAPTPAMSEAVTADAETDLTVSESCAYAALNQAPALTSAIQPLSLRQWSALTAPAAARLAVRAQPALRPPARAPPVLS